MKTALALPLILASALAAQAPPIRVIEPARAESPGVMLERFYLEELMKTHDAVEGIEAFLAKRPPEWRNR